MQLPYSEELNIGNLSRLFSNTSECYKLFWFQAIMSKLDENRNIFTFFELVNEMIADAWYMVTEYHLNLGPKDNLEAVVKHIAEVTHFKSSEKKSVILDYLQLCEDKEVLRMKRILIMNVPYRLQAPFMLEFRGTAWEQSGKSLAEEINKQKHLMYYFIAINGLYSKIELEDEWVRYLHKNKEIVKGWIQYSMIQYLQKRNPNVPGIVDKLYPPKERNLTKVIKYWKIIMDMSTITEIYGHNVLTEKDISIDHFVPWSYVAHDEFWNLNPTTKSINSSKSNYLPDWNIYFPELAKLEYLSYKMLWQYDKVYNEFKKCAKEHLNNVDIEYRLYSKVQSEEEFFGKLKEIVFPVYESARNSGFGNWMYKSE